MTLKISNEELRSLIPNVIHEVEGESTLLGKLLPWLESAEDWLIENIVGKDYNIQEDAFAKKIIVAKAFAQAVPSLDLTLTPAGFAVISTEGRSPASKERVERLIASLYSSVEANIQALIKILLNNEQWRNTPMGDYWLGTFMSGLDDAMANKQDNDLLTTYRSMREFAIMFQNELASKYIGKNILHKIRAAGYLNGGSHEASSVWYMVRRAELCYIASHFPGHIAVCPNEHEVWHLAEPILQEIKNCRELHEVWLEEMGDVINVEPFKNTRHGGFFF